jgi:hypothetical protein
VATLAVKELGLPRIKSDPLNLAMPQHRWALGTFWHRLMVTIPSSFTFCSLIALLYIFGLNQNLRRIRSLWFYHQSTLLAMDSNFSCFPEETAPQDFGTRIHHLQMITFKHGDFSLPYLLTKGNTNPHFDG